MALASDSAVVKVTLAGLMGISNEETQHQTFNRTIASLVPGIRSSWMRALRSEWARMNGLVGMGARLLAFNDDQIRIRRRALVGSG